MRVQAPVILRPAVLRDVVHLRAAVEAMLRRVRAELHVDFGDGVHVGRAAEIAAAVAVSAVDAVDLNRLTTAAADVWHVGREPAAKHFLIVRHQCTPGRIFSSEIGSRPRIDRFSTWLRSRIA